MIDRTFSNSLAVADIAPKAATRLPEPSRGDGAFSEALAGAHSVHDRRESQAASSSRRDWARSDRTAERSRGQERAQEVRNDGATTTRVDQATGTATTERPSTSAADARTGGDQHTATTERTEADTTTTDAAAAAEATVATPAGEGEGAAAAQATAAVAAAAQATVAVAAAPIAADVDAVVVPTTTTTTTTAATQVATDAVDAAMRLAIDADAAATPATAPTDATAAVAVDAPDVAVDADADAALVATLAPGSEDGETGDAAGPTRLLASAPATTSGPSPEQLAATADVDAAAEVAVPTQPVATQAAQQQVVTADVTAVAEGDDAGAAAQLVQAIAVDGDDAALEAPITDAAVVTQAKAGKADATETDADAAFTGDAEADPDAQLAPGAQGRANATTAVQNPTALAQVQANAQVQAKAAEAAAEEGGDGAAAPKLEPLSSSQGQPLTAATRDAQVAAGVRMREGLVGGDLQDRIDHIADQLATRLRLSQAAGGSQVQLSLKPRELGEVTVQMNVRDGAVAATILVDKADTLRTLQTNIEDLKRSLENQGLAIQEFSVDVRGEAGAGGANARAAADLRQAANRTSTGSAASVAGAAAVMPGLSGDREVDADALHDGDVSVLA